jgi:16S rRNA (adenine1518-N6/adenine1519-N6)-dimethyltransferase
MSFQTKKALDSQNLKPSKRLGQNFLINEHAIEKVISSANISPDDFVLEIGPRTGNLTKLLCQKAKKVVAIEKDRKIIDLLKNQLKENPNLEIINADALKIDLKKIFKNKEYKVVANLPFYITAPIIRKLLECKTPPTEMTIIVQKEVGIRICQKPGSMNILAASVQFYASPKVISYIKKGSFYPVPKVDSAIIKITPFTSKFNKDKKFREQFFKLTKIAFSQPRKQLLNNLSHGFKKDKETVKSILKERNIKPEQRAETLTIDDLISLSTCELLLC